MTKREEVQKFVENYEKEIINEAALLKCAKMPEVSKELFELFSKTGNRLNMRMFILRGESISSYFSWK